MAYIRTPIGTLTVRVSFDVTLWEAIKWRIAGREFREEIVKRMRETRDDEGEEWKRC